MFYKKKQRKEDERMKKKVLAFLLASTMVIEPFSVASAADFSDGIEQDVVQFSDDGEDVPEVETMILMVRISSVRMLLVREKIVLCRLKMQFRWGIRFV